MDLVSRSVYENPLWMFWHTGQWPPSLDTYTPIHNMHTVSDRRGWDWREGWELRCFRCKPIINEDSLGYMEVRKERAYLESVSIRFQHGYEGLGGKQGKVNWGPLTGGYECQVAVCNWRIFNSYLFGTILSPNLCWSQGVIKLYQSESLLFGGESQHETTQLNNKTLAVEVHTILRGQKMGMSSSHRI